MMEKTEKIAILEKLVSIDTTDQAEGVIADYLADLFAQHGIHTEKVASKPGRENLVAYLGEATDMKSGLAALVIAMIELHDEHVPLNGQIKLPANRR